MELFHRMAFLASAKLMGASAGRRITNEQLARELELMALGDPELAEHYGRLAAALPALQAQRAAEDAEVGPSPRISPIDQPRAA
jgi:hypothetical protein